MRTVLKMFYGLVLFFIVNYAGAGVSGQHDATGSDLKLELVQAIFRHGDRTPDKYETYPKDDYKEYKYEPHGYGQLTTRGKLRAYELGQILRKQYGAFLGQYKSGDVYAYNTGIERTKMTLKLALSSLYFPFSVLTWNQDLEWFPIPTHSNSAKSDIFFQMLVCSEYQELIGQAKKLPEVKAKLDENKKFFEYLKNNSGLNITLETAVLLYSNIHTQTGFGLPFPDWCTKEVFEKLEDSKALFFDLYTYTNRMNQIVGGPLIKMFIANMNASESRDNHRKIHLYSAHDVNVLTFLRAHGITTPRLIDYGYTVILEKLRGNDDKIYIRLLSWPGSGERLTVLKLQNCSELCSWEEYLKIVDSVLPSGEECGNKTFGILDSLTDGNSK